MKLFLFGALCLTVSPAVVETGGLCEVVNYRSTADSGTEYMIWGVFNDYWLVADTCYSELDCCG